MAARPAAKPAGKCTCNLGYLLVALVLMAVGLYVLVMAFSAQWSGGTYMTVLPWYFAGLLLMFFGKMAKWKSHGTCPAHGKM